MSDFAISGIMERLSQLDDDLVALYGYSKRFEIVIVGGGALMLTNLAPESRFTSDIDILTSSAEIESFFNRYDMNADVSTFLFQYPENWRKRHQKIDFDGEVLDVFTLSNEDIAITKLLAWRDSDKEDLLNMKKAGSINDETLWAILNDPTELEVNMSEEEWTIFIEKVHEFLDW